VTDAVLEEVTAWQSRGLEATYAIVFFDAIRVKIRNEGMVNNRAVYPAIGVRCSGHKEILGLWIEQTEGAKFWLRVMTELRNRGTQDILDRRGRRAQRFSRGDHLGVSPNPGPDLHRTSHPLLDALRRMERTPAGSDGAQTNLPSRSGRGGAGAAGRF
jgi:hypothetical protein